MGNCGGICNTTISKLKGDIIINSEQETGKYYEQKDIKKIIYIQRNIKKYLKKLKCKKKLN